MSIVELIDQAIQDNDVSEDAMRWDPDMPEPGPPGAPCQCVRRWRRASVLTPIALLALGALAGIGVGLLWGASAGLIAFRLGIAATLTYQAVEALFARPWRDWTDRYLLSPSMLLLAGGNIALMLGAFWLSLAAVAIGIVGLLVLTTVDVKALRRDRDDEELS